MREKSLEQQAVDFLTIQGWTCQIVQHRKKGGRTKDLFGCVDIVAIKAAHPIAGIQVTDTKNYNARIKKVLNEPRMLTWVKTGASLEVWGMAEGLPKKLHIFHVNDWRD